MDTYRRLADVLKGVNPQVMTIMQGKMGNVDGNTCTVIVDDIEISDVRLRASTTDNENEMLIVPKLGTTVIVGSLTGNLDELVILSYDEIETISINGGALGGLVKINELKTQLVKVTARIDGIISAINAGVVTAGDGGSALLTKIKAGLAQITNKESFNNIEDDKIKH